MDRTDVQVKADEALATAIQNVLEVYGLSDPGEMLTEFLVLSVTQRLTDDGVVVTSHPILFKDGDMPWYKIMGILAVHTELGRKLMLEGRDNG